ncbi:hypothetical protein IMZ48_10450 [Candidatus Bathyarchaeota archaeon]|nr:hypothetical protein [Candidatus Bathyarchaeota archaeon]
MGGQGREGTSPRPPRAKFFFVRQLFPRFPPLTSTRTGGKAKPLKAAKKGPKAELDDEDIAYQEKKRAGMSSLRFLYPAEIDY